MTRNLWIGVAATVLCGSLTLPAQKADSAESLLQAATKRELVDGDLAGAIEGYKKALAAAKGNRALAAQALLQLGQCYRKQGNAEARRTFERLLREYADQTAAVAKARDELAALPASADRPRFRKIRVPTMLLSPRFGAQLSPDGTRLAFLSGGAIWAVPVPGKVDPDTAGEPLRLTDPMQAWGMGLAWSGDGKWIAFNAGKEAEEIYIVSSAGGNPRRIAVSSSYHPYLSLSPDGQSLAYAAWEGDNLYINSLPVAGGVPKRLTEANTEEPAFSPDGKRLAYVRLFPRQADGNRRGEIRVIPVGGGQSVLVTQIPNRARSPMWSPDGKMLAFLMETGRGNERTELWVVPVSEEGRATMPPASIKLPRESYEPLVGWTAENRIGLIINTPEQIAIYTVPASGGMATQVTPVTSGYAAFEPRWSPDGKTIWFRVGPPPPVLGFVPAGGGKISTVPIGSKKEEKSQLPEWIESIPGGGNAVSPDGRTVVFAGGRRPYAAGPYLWTIPVAGGEPVQLTKDPGGDSSPCWFPDGKTVAFRRDKAIYTVPATGGELRRITSASEAVAWAGIACSPDGRSVAYFGDDRTLRIKPSSGGEARTVTKVGFVWGHHEISWSPDGNRIAYSAAQKIWIVSSDGGTPAELRTGLLARPTNLAWSPDGAKIAFTAIQGNDPELWLLEDFLPLVQAKR